MAAKYPSFASAAADDLVCPICYQFFVTPYEPKNLPKCVHMCCCICLKKMTEGGLTTVTCPQCSKVSDLPEEGVDGLLTALATRNLAEKHPEGIKERKDQIHLHLQLQKELKSELLRKEKQLREQIRWSIEEEVEEVERLVESVMRQAQEVICKIRAFGKIKLSTTEQSISKLERLIKDINRAMAKMKKMDDAEFLTQTDVLEKQIEGLKIQEPARRWEDRFVGKFIPHKEQFGRFVKPRRLELVHEFGEFECALSLASTPNGMLAVCDAGSNPQRVHVFKYDNDEYKKQFYFDLDNVDPHVVTDIAVSTEGKYLITKYEEGFEVYSANGRHQRSVLLTTRSRQDKSVISITTTHDGRILTGHIFENKRRVSIFEGNILKTISTSIAPFRTASVHGTHVAVGDFDQHVCVYDLETGEETLALDIPKVAGICHDDESDCLLIGRTASEQCEDKDVPSGSCIIEQYCRVTGKRIAVLARGLAVAPGGISITQNRMLAVTDGKTVKVYNMM